MTPTQYARTLARWWWLVLAFAGVGLFLGMTSSQLPPEQYVASANVLLKPNPATNFAPADVSAANSVATQRVQSYADIADGPDVLAALSQEVGIPTAELGNDLTFTVPPGTSVITASYTDPDAETAQQVTAAAAKAVVRTVRQAENRGDAGAVLLASISNRATAVAVVPQVTPWRNPGLTAAAGLLLGMAIAVAVSRADRRLRSPETVAAELDAPVLVEVPVRGRRLSLPRPGRDDRAAAAVAELRTLVLFAGGSTRNKGVCVALTSPSGTAALPGVAAELARSVAGTGASVLLVEADLRAPAIGEYLDLGGVGQPGLAGFLEHRQDDGELVQHHAASGVDVIVGGRPADGSPADLLHSSAYSAVLDDAANRYDVVLVTAPGMRGRSDAAAVAAQADLVLVLVERGRTRRRDLGAAATTLRRVDSTVLGAVLLT